jgi:hypothetical protein
VDHAGKWTGVAAGVLVVAGLGRGLLIVKRMNFGKVDASKESPYWLIVAEKEYECMLMHNVKAVPFLQRYQRVPKFFVNNGNEKRNISGLSIIGCITR